jgi:hypothetical protein
MPSLNTFEWESKPAYFSCSFLYFSTRLRGSYIAISPSTTVTACDNSHCLRMTEVSLFCLLSLQLLLLNPLFVLIGRETNIFVIMTFTVYTKKKILFSLLWNQINAPISQIYFVMKIYMFRTVHLSIIRSLFTGTLSHGICHTGL